MADNGAPVRAVLLPRLKQRRTLTAGLVMRLVLVAGARLACGVVVMVNRLGGMAVFGINGFIIGPTIAAMFIAVGHPLITTPSRAKSSRPSTWPELFD